MEVLLYLVVVVGLAYLFVNGIVSKLIACRHKFDKLITTRELTQGKQPDGTDRVVALIYVKECSLCGEIKTFKFHKDEAKA